MKVKYNPQNNTFEKSYEYSLLPHIMWHITDRCDLNCKTCFDKGRKKSNHELSLDQVDYCLSVLQKFGVQKIDISGGEPLVYENLPSLVDRALAKGFYLTITTRGIGTETNKQWINRNWRKFTRIIVSLDGGSPQICDEYANHHGTFENTIGFCNNLGSNGCNIVRINTVVNRCILDDCARRQLEEVVGSIMPLEWCVIEPHPANKLPTFDFYAVTEIEFQKFAEDIKTRLPGKTSLLLRRNSMYSTYWVLYPDNTISRLSETKGYSFSTQLCDENIQTIKDILARVDHIIP